MKLFGAATMSSVVPAGVSRATPEPEGSTIERHNLPFPEYKGLKLDELQSVSHEPLLLSLSKESLDDHLRASDLSGRDFELAEKYITNLRKQYPTEEVQTEHKRKIVLENPDDLPESPRDVDPVLDGSYAQTRTTSGLGNPRKDSEKRARRLASGIFHATEEVSERIQPEATTDNLGTRGSLWVGPQHEDITSQVLSDINSDETVSDWQTWSKQPDGFAENANGNLEPKDDDLAIGFDVLDYLPFTESGFATEIRKALVSAWGPFWDHYAQFYDPLEVPIPFTNFDVPIQDIGMAPEAAQYFSEVAKNSSGDKKAQRAAWITHYMADIAVPLHAGAGGKQLNADPSLSVEVPPDITIEKDPRYWLHEGVEKQANDHWNTTWSYSGNTYGNHADDFAGSTGAEATPASTSVKQIADTSSDYAVGMFNDIMDSVDPGNKVNDYEQWNDDARSYAFRGMSNSFDTCGYYMRGFLYGLGYGE